MTVAERVFNKDFSVRPISMWKGSSNNYAYLVTDIKTKESLLVDPAEPEAVLANIKEDVASKRIDLKYVLNTHHHWDHAGGNAKLREIHSGLSIFGGKDCQLVSRVFKHDNKFNLGSAEFTALHTPCHTNDSICWHVKSTQGNDQAVFTGDTLFHGGCGRFFEGTPQQMHTALNKTLASLPNNTVVYPGHEYTKNNWKFIDSLLAHINDSQFKERVERFRPVKDDETCGKYTIGDEMQYNPFMLVNTNEMKKVTGKTDPVDVMAALREMKNKM